MMMMNGNGDDGSDDDNDDDDDDHDDANDYGDDHEIRWLTYCLLAVITSI